jgi:Protein of unknown function (DUF2911)
MKKLRSILMLAALCATLPVALPARAQDVGGETRISPHATVSQVIGDSRVTVVYGRPYVKDPKTGQDRVIWGGLVPYDQVWRTGADEATLLITEKPIAFGATKIPAGVYTLWTLPAKDGSAKLIVNKQVGQWGTGPGTYDPQRDLARIDLKREPLAAPVTQLTIGIGKDPAGGVLKMAWEKTQYSAAFTVAK